MRREDEKTRDQRLAIRREEETRHSMAIKREEEETRDQRLCEEKKKVVINGYTKKRRKS